MAIKRIEKNDLVAKGALDNLTEGAKESKAAIDLLKKALEAVVALSKQVKKDIPTPNPSKVKGQKELNELTERANKLARNKLTIEKQLLKEQEQLKQKTQSRNKLLKEEVALQKTQVGSLSRLRAESKKLVKERNNLNISTTKGAKRLKEINKQLDINNKVLQKNASALGKQKINIGNYGSAVGKLKGALGQLGLAFGVFALVRSSFNIIKDFGQAQADLASVLGVSTDQMSRLTEQAKELGATTTFTASQVSLLQKEYAKLGFTQKEIENVTEATLLLAEATGTDLARAAEVTGSTIRAFGLDTSETKRVTDVMAKAFSSSSLDMEKFAVSMRSVAPVAKTAGLNIEQTTALLGTLTDRGLDASTAGTSLRNVFLELSKSGMTFEDAMAEINKSTDKNKTALELFGKRGATTGVILSETADDVATLTDKLYDSADAAEQMAETQRNTLGGSLKLLQSAFEGFILKMNEAGGVGEKLRKGIAFLADNFGSIVSALGKAIRMFVAFKVAMKAIQFSQGIGGLRGLVAGFKSIGTSAKGASIGAKKLGVALKGIGFALAITVLIELAVAFYDIASGASEARRQQDLFNDATKKSSEEVTEFLKIEDEIIKKQRQENELLIVKGKLKEKESAAQLKLLNLAKQQKALDIVSQTKKEIIQIRELTKIQERQKITNAKRLDDVQAGSDRYERVVDRVNVLNSDANRIIQNNDDKIKGLRTRITAFGLVASETGDEIHDYTVTIADNSDKLGNNTDEVIEATKETKKLLKAKKQLADFDDRISTQETIDSEKDSFDLSQRKKVIAKEIEILKNGSVEEEAEQIKKIKRLLTQQQDYLENKAEQRLFDSIDNAKNQEDVILAQQRYTNELIKIDQDFVDKKASIKGKEIEVAKETEAEKIDIAKAGIDVAQNYFIKAADERIAKIDEEMDKAKKQSDYFRELAANGNISAKESLAEQNQLIAKAAAEKEKIEKRKQRILLVSSVLQAYNSNLSQDMPSGEALTKALTSTTLITQFVNALPAFEDGTENTSLDGRGKNVDGKGGFHAVLHQNERVLTSGQNNMIGNYSNDEVASIMEKHRLGKLMPDSQMMVGFGTSELVNKLMNVEAKLDQVTKAIQDKPVPNIELGEITQSYMVLNKRVESGKGTTTSKFKVQ